jgi:D-inositol-3-phosphate glycosyltransferase
MAIAVMVASTAHPLNQSRPARRLTMPDRSRPHLLLFGWYQPGTGFTRVLEALLPELAKVFRITWFGVGYRGAGFDWSEHVHVQPTNLHGGDLVGAYEARLRWDELQADAVFALNDIWYLIHYSRELAGVLNGVPMIGYLPLDGHLCNPADIEELIGFERLITYTESAATDLRAALKQIGIDTPVSRAGHGVNLASFHPLDPEPECFNLTRRMQRAQDYFGLAEPSIVILNASRPDPRKRIDLTLEGFANLVRGRPANIHLCLHQAFAHAQFVEPLREQARALGIQDRILWHPATPGVISDDELNRLYNACAVGINTAAGEGFGLVSFEHAAAAVPQIIPNQPALAELWGDSALRLPVESVKTDFSPLLMCQVKPDDVATTLSSLLDDTQQYARYAKAAFTRTQQSDLHWDDVAAKIRGSLLECVPDGRVC